MLALTGAVRLWYIPSTKDMRLGKYRLLEAAKEYFPNVYNGDAFVFMSKDRRKLKIVRCLNHQTILYEVTYERGYTFMRPVYRKNIVSYQLDFKYLVALLNCPVRKDLQINTI